MRRELLSQRAGARQLGMSLSNLQHHVRRGNLTLIEGKVDLEVAKIQLAKYIDPEQSARARNGQPRNFDLVPSTPSEPPVVPASVPPPLDTPELYWEAKTRREIAEATKAELELQAMSGNLVNRGEAERAAFEANRMLRDMLLSVPSKLAATLAAMSSPQEIETTLRDELQRVLGEVVRIARAGLPGLGHA